MSSTPLKFTAGSASGNAKGRKAEGVNGVAPSSGTTTTTTAAVKQSATTTPEDISSPHELTAYVENLLSQLEARFDDMSSQILDRMGQMSSRVDSLENAMQDLINDDIARPSTPSTPGAALGVASQRPGSLNESGA